MPKTFSRRVTITGVLLALAGSFQEIVQDPTTLAALTSLVGAQIAAKFGAIVAVLGTVLAGTGRALGEPAPAASEPLPREKQ